MRCLVTGAAGFIGSHLCERLLLSGHDVMGLDAFVPYYARELKEDNLEAVREHSRFVLLESDLRYDDLAQAIHGVDVVFHLAAMAGLPKSWTEFDLYESCNVTATQRLLSAVERSGKLNRFIYASTSSVYGRFATGDESMPARPISPYGVTKLAAEQLCRAYAEEKGLPLTVLRYFSVYGPRQRPDMGYHRFIDALLHDRPITVFGDGHQMRGNTFISDCIDATLLALQALPGETYNIGGGETASVWDILRKLETLIGRRAVIRQEPARVGDQRSTCADTTKMTRHLGWVPRIGLDQGLSLQIDWQRKLAGQRPHASAA